MSKVQLQRQIHRAEMETSNHSFSAYGDTAAEAKTALEAGLKIHGAQYQLSPNWYASFEQSCYPIALGQPYRHREPLPLPVTEQPPIPLYMREFPEMGPLDFEIPFGFQDTSWHNDVCRSFSKSLFNGQELRLWVDHKEAADREYPESTRFVLALHDEGSAQIRDIVASDDFSVIDTAIEAFNPGLTPYQFLRDVSRMTREQACHRLPYMVDYPETDKLVCLAAEADFYDAGGSATDWPMPHDQELMLHSIRDQDLRSGLADRRFSIHSRDLCENVAQSDVPFHFFLGMDDLSAIDRFDVEQLEVGIRLWIREGDGFYIVDRKN